MQRNRNKTRIPACRENKDRTLRSLRFKEEKTEGLQWLKKTTTTKGILLRNWNCQQGSRETKQHSLSHHPQTGTNQT